MASVIKYKNDINVISVYSSDFFCRCFPLYYLTSCVGSLLRTQLAEFLPMFGCFFRIVRIWAIIAFTRLGFQNRQNLSTFFCICFSYFFYFRCIFCADFICFRHSSSPILLHLISSILSIV